MAAPPETVGILRARSLQPHDDAPGFAGFEQHKSIAPENIAAGIAVPAAPEAGGCVSFAARMAAQLRARIATDDEEIFAGDVERFLCRRNGPAIEVAPSRALTRRARGPQAAPNLFEIWQQLDDEGPDQDYGHV
jgi:hypothetical protein